MRQFTSIHGITFQWQTSHNVALLIYLLAKRTMDLTLVTLSFIFLWPLLFAVGLAIRLDSEGPALFRQERMGARWVWLNGRLTWQIQPFSIYKFRTMYHNTDDSLHKAHIKKFVNNDSAQEGSFKLQRDPRITRVGKILRRTSLDELPQVLNVLLGDMSLVGPRPVPLYEVEAYEDRHYERFGALQGITGYWQVWGRSRVSFEEMIAMDIEYARNPSLSQDIKILLWTVPAVFSGDGAG